MSKLMVCCFAALALTANAVEIIDLTAAARAVGNSARTITASSKNLTTGRPPSNAFDGWYSANSALAWWTDPDSESGTDQWIQYQFNDSFEEGKTFRLTSYQFGVNTGWSGTKETDCKMPKSWQFLGSNDGTTWDVLDEQSGFTRAQWATKEGQPYEFPLRIYKCYRYYRLHLTSIIATDATCQFYVIPEIMFKGEIVSDEASITMFRYWNGGVSTDWNVAANWAPGADGRTTVPQDGEYVWLGDYSAAAVTLDQSTAELAGLILGGQGLDVSITATGWETAIRADEFFVKAKGVLTCSPCTAVGEPTNRVHVVCGDLTVESGGKISADFAGYANGRGPAPANSNGNRAAAHGGHGGGAYRQVAGYANSNVYGDAENPCEPGSGGKASGCYGGGVIRIEASGCVTVDGTVSANGSNVSQYNGKFTNCTADGAGSGGSVNIVCASFAGTGGTVSAKGGGGALRKSDTGVYQYGSVGCPGGGGRLAIHVAAGGDVNISGMTFSVAGGDIRGGAYTADSLWYSKVTDEDKYFCDAGMGSLWFSDDAFLAALNGDGTLFGYVKSAHQLTLDTLVLANGFVRLGDAGGVINVTGDVVISNDTARLELGGEITSNRSYRAEYYTASPMTLNVGGDFRVVNGGRFDVRAAATNGTDEAGAYVDVAGDMLVGAGSTVYCWSDVENGGSPKFSAANVTVEEGALVSADFRGFAGGWCKDTSVVMRSYGLGPGGALCGNGAAMTIAGAGHGGNGGNASEKLGGLANDDPYHPMLPGSGGGASWKYSYFGGAGGGVVNIAATNAIVVNGTISADGEKCTGGSTSSGAGGTVLLSAPNVSGAATGRISACGAESTTYVNGAYAFYNGSSSGGRVAISTGCPWYKGIPKSRMRRSTEPIVSWLGGPTYAGTVDVSGGPQKDSGEYPECAGEPGTCWFVDIREAPGVLLLLR